jgi:hypothetical protein
MTPRTTMIVLVLTVGVPALGASQSSSTSAPPSPSPSTHTAATVTVPSSLVGRWTAAAERIPQSDDSAWGRNTTFVRLTELLIRPDGTGTLTVTSRVVNRAGAAIAGSRTVDRAEFTLGAEQRPEGLRPRYTTTIKQATRRYPDPPIVEVTAEGVRLEIILPLEGDSDSVEVDYSVFRGGDSFSATLQRQKSASRGQE